MNEKFNRLWSKTSKFYAIKEVQFMSHSEYSKALSKSKFKNSLPVKINCSITGEEKCKYHQHHICYALGTSFNKKLDYALRNSFIKNNVDINVYSAIEEETNTEFYIMTETNDKLRIMNKVKLEGLAYQELQMGQIYVMPNKDSLNKILQIEYID